MTVSIANNSANIVVTQRPTVNHPVVSGSEMAFTGGNITATGEVTLNGVAGDDASGWTAGFIQAQWVETNWCNYRGQRNSDGSIFVQRGRPPARFAQACRDCVDTSPVNNIFYNANGLAIARGGLAGTAFPQRLTFNFFDSPSETCNLIERNSLTGQPNYLDEAQFEFFFCTVLSVRDPAGAFHHLASFYWNQRWQAKFKPLTFGAVPTFQITPLAGTGANMGPVIRGVPTDVRFTNVLTSPQSQSCNQVFRAARAAVTAVGAANRHESRVWTSHDVRQP
ncbi:MAG: hypothetical protein FWD67_03350 [Betaproteobacteria bacterium]|nr:hypothetical protein [Betaproteobacteria bacterium]